MAEGVVQKTLPPTADVASFADADLLENPRYGDYARNAVKRYGELEAIVAGLTR